MSLDWAGLGPGLLLPLDRSRTEPLRAQLERGLRDAIRTERLRAGERLPSSRVLARELGISRGLVLEAYAQLQAEGYLTARSGSATRVAAGAGGGMRGPVAGLATPANGSAPRADPTVSAGGPRIDFRPGLPDLGTFPRRDWAWAVREACRTAPAADLGYGDPRGSAVLRDVLAGYLRRVRGMDVDPGRIVVCTGFAQGLGLVLRALAAGGVRRVACEDPGDPHLAEDTGRAGLEAVPVPVDAGGIDVAALEECGARAAIVTPAHQAPTGVVLAPERRRALLAWAHAHGATVVEDDYDAEFRYDRDPVGSLQGLAPERVASIGSVSKSLAPGLRLGWIVCPAALVEAVAHEKELHDRGSPVLDQLALAALLQSGRYDRHLRAMRGVYAGRRRVLVEALRDRAPAVRLSGLSAGFHAVAELPMGAEEAGIVAAARARSVGLRPMAVHRWSKEPAPARLVLGFGNLTERQIRDGIDAVADLLR